MSVVKQKGNMYEFVTHMWSPIKGKCKHDCSYCYMKNPRWDIGKLRIVEKDMRNRLGENRVIFVCHTVDLFADDVPEEWIKRVLAHCKKYPTNRYLFQTKNPRRMINFVGMFPSNALFGTTIETNRTNYYESKAPPYRKRAEALGELSSMGLETMVTIEPIFDFDLDELVEIVIIANPAWVNVGADSKGHNLPEPSKEKVRLLIETLQAKTSVELKRNLSRILKDMR